MSAETDLLPCPFCGGPAHLERQGHVCCMTRFCRGAGAFDNYGTPTEQNASAVARWNTRANLAELQREVEGLRAEVAVAMGDAMQARAELKEWRGAAAVHKARAERLAGALRGLLNDTQHKDHNCGDAEWCPVIAARAALDQETTNG